MNVFIRRTKPANIFRDAKSYFPDTVTYELHTRDSCPQK